MLINMTIKKELIDSNILDIQNLKNLAKSNN